MAARRREPLKYLPLQAEVIQDGLLPEIEDEVVEEDLRKVFILHDS